MLSMSFPVWTAIQVAHLIRPNKITEIKVTPKSASHLIPR